MRPIQLHQKEKKSTHLLCHHNIARHEGRCHCGHPLIPRRLCDLGLEVEDLWCEQVALVHLLELHRRCHEGGCTEDLRITRRCGVLPEHEEGRPVEWERCSGTQVHIKPVLRDVGGVFVHLILCDELCVQPGPLLGAELLDNLFGRLQLVRLQQRGHGLNVVLTGVVQLWDGQSQERLLEVVCRDHACIKRPHLDLRGHCLETKALCKLIRGQRGHTTRQQRAQRGGCASLHRGFFVLLSFEGVVALKGKGRCTPIMQYKGAGGVMYGHESQWVGESTRRCSTMTVCLSQKWCRR